MSQTIIIPLLISAVLVISGLSFYAGKLLWQLKQQNQRQQDARQKRIHNITESIQVIAKAMEQQQCELSEGCIRICNLLKAMPLENIPNYSNMYPSIHRLYGKIEHMPTHEAREALSKFERRQQDTQRAEWEAEMETSILPELAALKTFNIS